MPIRKIRKCISPLFTAVILICTGCAAVAAVAMPACAAGMTAYAHEVPDESRTGAITIEMQYDSRPVAGGTLTAYRVGQIQEDNGGYFFLRTEEFQAFEGTLEEGSSQENAGTPEGASSLELTKILAGPFSPELAKALSAYAEGHSITPAATVQNADGTAVFNGLELGLYLIVQTEAAPGYEPMNPFLVSVPMWEEGHYQYDVSAWGKFELKQASKPEEPVTPTDPKLPQTGQLNWPVPVLAVSGMGLLLLGRILYDGGKKKGNVNTV